MKRLALTSILLGLLAIPASAPAAGSGGHNSETTLLEQSFTVALSARVDSKNGCYPSARKLATVIRKRKRYKTAVAGGLGGVRDRNVVHVLRAGTSCNNARLALRGKSLYVLDSGRGEVVLQGRAAARRRAKAIQKANRGPLRALTSATEASVVKTQQRRLRFTADCPGSTLPLGGGMTSDPGTGADGEGLYPHSFERLGAQQGWHITAWLFNPNEDAKTPRRLGVQVVCGKGLAPMSSPHRTVFTKPGQTKTVVARCPGGQVLMSGGFQRTDFLADGGNYITESRAISANAWQVRARAYGEYGGELTAIAYCVKSSQPLLTEVTASTPLPFSTAASVTTPPCPDGQRLTSGGFTTEGTDQTFFSGGSINPDNTWTASGYGYFGAATNLTAYGYCLRPGV